VACRRGVAEPAVSYFVRFLLLTATRRTEAAAMRRSEVLGEEWTIPKERYKTGLELVLPLSPAARAVLDKVPSSQGRGVSPPTASTRFRVFKVQARVRRRHAGPAAQAGSRRHHAALDSARSAAHRAFA